MIQSWMQGYLEAWGSDDPDDIAALFTEDARYFTEPFAQPWEGQEEIVRRWIEGGDSKVDWTFEYDVIAEEGDVAVVRGRTHYAAEEGVEPKPAHDYDNLWIVRFAPDGRASEFTEWWMKVPKEDA